MSPLLTSGLYRHAALPGGTRVTKALSDIGTSVQARLLRIARERGQDFQLILTRYANERLLYRLASSEKAAVGAAGRPFQDETFCHFTPERLGVQPPETQARDPISSTRGRRLGDRRRIASSLRIRAGGSGPRHGACCARAACRNDLNRGARNVVFAQLIHAMKFTSDEPALPRRPYARGLLEVSAALP